MVDCGGFVDVDRVATLRLRHGEHGTVFALDPTAAERDLAKFEVDITPRRARSCARQTLCANYRADGIDRRSSSPVEATRIVLRDHIELNPAVWYANEASWLDWALHELGHRPLADLLATTS